MSGIIEEVEKFFGSAATDATNWVTDEEGNLKRTAVSVYHRADNIASKITAFLTEKEKSIAANTTPLSLLEELKTEMVKLF